MKKLSLVALALCLAGCPSGEEKKDTEESTSESAKVGTKDGKTKPAKADEAPRRPGSPRPIWARPAVVESRSLI